MMFSRVLLVALCIVYATSLTPLTAPADDDCALYLTGPGRSSAYDYSLNLLKGNFAYDGQHTCITYEAINQAYLDARSRILVAQPKGDWKAEDFASVGELLLDVSISLARTYGLTYEEVEKGLPLIDTSRTLIREVCPPVFSHVECRAGKYRRLDGLCNNLRHPTWGATMAPFQRLIGPLFADGINAPRISHTGRDLPLSRVVSRTMHPDDGFHDHAGTVMVIAWGQFMDHDYTLTGTPLDPVHRNDPEECCKRPLHLKHPYCNEIRVPDDDYFYRLFGVKCIDFVRGFPSPRPGCRLGSRIPFNTLTGAIDGNTVYGVTEKFARKLRTGYGGLLRMNPVFKEYGLKDLLPLKLDIPDEGCTRPNKNMYCFEAGEIRVNEQLVLTVMHTLMAREHNRVAEALAAVNPHWDDETLFQEARRINIAEIQHITYNEFLPILLGKDVMEKFGLVLEKEGYWDGYDPEVNPDVIASFAAAAYRFGHSLLPTAVERWSKAHKFIASKRLSDLIRRPYDLYRAGVLDEYVMGLMNQVAQAMDDSITQEVTNHLFKKVGARFGMDLVSFNMQRGREFGLPGYMEFRKFCGLSGADSFQDLFGSMPNETIHKYESIFEHPIDVDLWSGGVSERPLPGSMLGPTFACIIATQFSYSRRGDRFWFELPNQPSSFTHEQMAEIRKSRLARVICDNTDIIDTVQLYPMVLPDHELNPRVPCRSGIIPSMDFSKWAEPAPFLGGAKEYMTDAFIYNKTNDSGHTEKDIVINETNAYNSTEPSCLDQSQNINNAVLSVSLQQKVRPENAAGTTLQEIINNVDCTNYTNHKNKTNQNKIQTDTVLKYVYKKDDNTLINNKTKGHIKNSLKRKKRNVPGEIIHAAPLLFDSITKHDNKETESLELPDLTPDGIIKSANLADFNIETLHTKLKPTHIVENNQKYNRDENIRFPPLVKNTDTENSSSEEEDQVEKTIPKSYRNTNNNEFIEIGKDKLSEIQNIKESEENTHYPNIEKKEPFDKYSDKSESTEKDLNSEQQSKESEESMEQYLPKKSNVHYERDQDEVIETQNDKENARTALDKKAFNKEYSDKYTDIPLNTQEVSKESKENNEEYLPKQTFAVSDRGENFSTENDYNSREIKESENLGDKNLLLKSKSSEDSVEDSIENKNKFVSDIPTKENLSSREVDLVDLSHESIEDLGQDKTAKDFNDHNHIPSIKKPTNKSKEDLTLTDETNSNESNFNSKEYEKQVKINVGEVRPVIELNNEDSDEESEENSEDIIRANLRDTVEKNLNTDTSLEIKPSKEDKVNVKQQFERIPLNYNHASKTTNTSKNEQDDSDGTLDTISPKTDNSDENLNIKFSDITVTLPEIKLPDDILSYAQEEPAYDNKKNNKGNYFYYDDSDENTDEESDNPNNDNENKNKNHDDFYKPYFYKPNENLKHENTDDEQDDKTYEDDPYEQFVRERFGKKKNFRRRSEKIQELTPTQNNPKLLAKIQNVLKKANNIQKEAEKSGDPKAGYLWTLEYGENL